MAEIPVERVGSSKWWLWLLLALLLIGLLLWWVLDDDDEAAVVEPVAVVTDVGTAPAPEIVGAQTPGADPVTPPEPVAMEQGVSIANILGSPSQYIGRNDFQAEVAVPEVPTDRGFWIEDQGNRMFALIIDNPQEVPKDINPGQRLRVTEGMIRDATFIGQIPGKPIDQDTRRILQQQDAFLIVDEENIEILSR